jgi:hypothetical protein
MEAHYSLCPFSARKLKCLFWQSHFLSNYLELRELCSTPLPAAPWLVNIFAGTLHVRRVDLLFPGLCMALGKVPTAAIRAIISLCIPMESGIVLLGPFLYQMLLLNLGSRRFGFGDA